MHARGKIPETMAGLHSQMQHLVTTYWMSAVKSLQQQTEPQQTE